MNLKRFKEDKFKYVIDSMVDFMNLCKEDDMNCGYRQTDINKCGKILDKYIDKLISLKGNENQDEIMTHVKYVTLTLNKLNLKTNYHLIETDERECLCQFILEAAIEAGLEENDYDITEEWRQEW